MFVNLPSIDTIADRLAPGGRVTATMTIWQLKAELQRLQRDTLIAIADCMDGTASQFERLNQPGITPDDLRREAQKLRDYANGGSTEAEVSTTSLEQPVEVKPSPLLNLAKAAIAACNGFDAQPNHGAPEAKAIMDNLRAMAEAALNA